MVKASIPKMEVIWNDYIMNTAHMIHYKELHRVVIINPHRKTRVMTGQHDGEAYSTDDGIGENESMPWILSPNNPSS